MMAKFVMFHKIFLSSYLAKCEVSYNRPHVWPLLYVSTMNTHTYEWFLKRFRNKVAGRNVCKIV